MKNLQLVIFLCYIFGLSYAIDSSPCGEWKPYKDEKCFQIFDKIGTQSFLDAEVACSQQETGASLVSIRSQEEQEFFSNFLFETSKVVDNVWLGAQRIRSNNSNKFKWIDGFKLDYFNWEKGHPTNEDGRDCIQMNSAFQFYFQNSVMDSTPEAGQWTDVPCQKKNLVVCQKLQNWSIYRLQKILLDTKKEFQDSSKNIKMQLKNHESTIQNHESTLKNHESTIKDQASTINAQQSTINNLKMNPIPINFIYTQLSNQPDPKSLWPTVEWKDVTSEYSGLFFRAEGKNSAAFGTIQKDNAPRVTQGQYADNPNHKNPITFQPNSWSEWIPTGFYGGNMLMCLRFYTSAGEVRPRNMAIRIWKRTG